jgi:formate dehydrogenase iron-sulfur subunit
MSDKAILFDATKCMACRACQVACKGWNELPGEETTNRGSYENPPDLSTTTWLKIKFAEVSSNGSIGTWLFTRRACMHCTDAGCVKACPTKALYYHELGFVAYDKNLCSGCGYCEEFCPFDVPRLASSGNDDGVLNKMDKCTFCANRVTRGEEPACVKTCPTEALVFGDRDKIVAMADARAAEVGGIVYGKDVVGGTHVLYVLDREADPELHGLPKDPRVPAMATAWQDILQPAGYVLGGVVALGLAMNYMVARARMVKEKEGS